MELDELPERIHPPQAYIVVRNPTAEGGQWFADVVRTCLAAVADSSSLEILGEELGADSHDVIGAALKITEAISSGALASLAEALRHKLSPHVMLRLVPGVRRSEIAIPAESLKVEYFRREHAVDSSMVWHTTSCVRLTHLPTGTVARSTDHRSRAVNYEEALFLLASLLGATSEL